MPDAPNEPGPHLTAPDLNAFFDGALELNSVGRVIAHLLACRACRREYRQLLVPAPISHEEAGAIWDRVVQRALAVR